MMDLSTAAQFNLQPVKEGVYIPLHVKSGCQLRNFKEGKRKFVRGCMFFEFDNDKENITEEMKLLFLEKVLYAVAIYIIV